MLRVTERFIRCNTHKELLTMSNDNVLDVLNSNITFAISLDGTSLS